MSIFKTVKRIWRNRKKDRANKPRGQTRNKEYQVTVFVPSAMMETINGYLCARSENEYQGEDNTITYTAKFPDGKEMDIKCCGCRNEASWTEAVLFSKQGFELACTEVEDEFTGPWMLSYQGVTYIAIVEVS